MWGTARQGGRAVARLDDPTFMKGSGMTGRGTPVPVFCGGWMHFREYPQNQGGYIGPPLPYSTIVKRDP